MATIRIEFETDNAAFEQYNGEIRKVLTQALNALREGLGAWTLRDSNGNTVGKVTVSE